MIYLREGKILVKDGKLCNSCCPCPAPASVSVTISGIVFCSEPRNPNCSAANPNTTYNNFGTPVPDAEKCKYSDNTSNPAWVCYFRWYYTGANAGKATVFLSCGPVFCGVFCQPTPGNSPLSNIFTVDDCDTGGFGDCIPGDCRGYGGTAAWSIS